MLFHVIFWNKQYDYVSTYDASMTSYDSAHFCMNDWFPYTADDTITIQDKDSNTYKFFVNKLHRSPKESEVEFKPIAQDLTLMNKNYLKIFVYDKKSTIKINVKMRWYDKESNESNDYYFYAGKPIKLEKFIITNLDTLKQKYHEKHDCYDLVYEKNKGLTQVYLFNDSRGDKYTDDAGLVRFMHYTKKLTIKK
jgi:hypothetical protein